jgi:hypothetical protein
VTVKDRRRTKVNEDLLCININRHIFGPSRSPLPGRPAPRSPVAHFAWAFVCSLYWHYRPVRLKSGLLCDKIIKHHVTDGNSAYCLYMYILKLLMSYFMFLMYVIHLLVRIQFIQLIYQATKECGPPNEPSNRVSGREFLRKLDQ